MRPPQSFLGQPIRDLQTMLRVLMQNDSIENPLVPDGIYGPATVAAVSAFQKAHGIPSTGVADQRTWNAVVAAYQPAHTDYVRAQPLEILLNPGQVFRRGDRSPHIYLVQGMLTAMSQCYASIPPAGLTGILDELTADSLASFQQLSGLPMTGNLDKATWKHLVLQYPLAASREQNRKNP